MALWKPDPTFYPSPRDAVSAPPEKLAYVAAFDRAAAKPDAIAVLDTDPASPSYGEVVGWTSSRMSATSCTTSAGTPAPARSAPGRRTHTWSAAT
ncbi:MAG: selenium-binding protein [Actinomycetia bacterium]|jgi:56kDa selenium binding protein (SBP56)|nr:selenium-binding protein [Actinomycetes bacterium]